jgi:polysaccharide deacetylase family protein (PEP-CTERM system associated)
MLDPATPANFLTFDVEEYYHVNYTGFDPGSRASERTNVPRLVDRLLEICAEAGVRSTFFVLGMIGEKYPDVVRSIHRAGHEVASHGSNHRGVRDMATSELRADVEKSCAILESLTGAKVQGFRAPSFSVDLETLPRFYEVLGGCGLRYSSSVFPGKTFLYGIPGFPRHPHRPAVDGRATDLVEFPITGFNLFGMRLPLYVRLLPARTLKRRMRMENEKGRPALLYVHPREIDLDQPRLPLSRTQGLIHYWGIRGCEAKLRRLLHRNEMRFGAIEDYLAADLCNGSRAQAAQAGGSVAHR